MKSRSIARRYWSATSELGCLLLESRRVSFIGLASHPPSRDCMGWGMWSYVLIIRPPFVVFRG